MDLLMVLLACTVFPTGALGFLLWMDRIEESIPEAVRRAVRQPDPQPVLAFPVRRPAVAIPAQRVEPLVVPTPVPAAASRAVTGT